AEDEGEAERVEQGRHRRAEAPLRVAAGALSDEARRTELAIARGREGPPSHARDPRSADASEASPRGVGPHLALPNGARGAIPSCDNLGPHLALPNGARGAIPSCDNLGPRLALPNGRGERSPR